MIRIVTAVSGCLIVPAFRGNVQLAPEDGFDSGLLSLLIEIHRAEHVAVIRDGNGGHSVLLGFLQQIAHADGTVQQAVLRVNMQMLVLIL